jgi:hypothetical protein
MPRFLNVILITLLASCSALAMDSTDAPQDILGVYNGYFQWDSQLHRAPVRFEFATKHPSEGGFVELEGSGEYRSNPEMPIRVKLRARYNPNTGFVEIWERDPSEGDPGFKTDGSHKGKFVNGTINAIWNTAGTGETGRLELEKANRRPGR